MIERTVVNRRYRVDRLVGEGGMAVVYHGHDLLLGRDVAIKVLRPQFASDPGFRARFEREAQAAAGFSHPHIIDIYDVGEEEGAPYIVMEFVRGQTLKEIIAAEAPFHPDDVAALLAQLCGALDYAHERGYVHRDVKPQNILVDERGRARVVDFGIAKGLADSDLTEIGTGLGTVHYLSPEQASGLMATPASDVYSVAVVAFEMLTGCLPFEADSAVGVAMRHVHDAPPRPSDLGPPLPPAVDAIVLRSLAKDPTRRFPTAGAFARAMATWRDRQPDAGEPPPGSPAPIRPPVNGPDQAPRAAAPMRSARSARPVSEVAPTGAEPAPSTTARSAAGRDDVGCATWVVGTALLAGLIGLVWLGFRLSPRLADLGSAGQTPTEQAAPLAPSAGAEDPRAVAPPASDQAPVETVPPIEPAAAPAVVPVPDLIGLSLDAAIDAVTGRGLILVQAGESFSESVPAGAVVGQDPSPEIQVGQGESVAVTISAGSARIDLGALQLAGRTVDEAVAMLQERGLAVERAEVASIDVAPGLVAGVEPATGARIGETVTVLISVGDRVRVPAEIQGQPIDQVERQLEELGMRVGARFPVGRETIEGFGLDLATAAIGDQDVVGVQGDGVDLDAWVAPGTEVDLVYYDRAQDQS